MIVSTEARLVFVHVWKTGGTSVAAALRDGLGVSESAGERGYVERLAAVLRRRKEPAPLGKHAFALDIRSRLGEDFERFHSFAFVRNPWDWLVSWYNFVTRATVSPDTGQPWRHHLYPVVGGMGFDEFVAWVTEEDGLDRTYARQHSSFAGRSPVLQRDWVADLDGNVIVDFVGKFENLASDFAQVAARIGRPDLVLPHVNRGEHASYRAYYSPATRDAVARYFGADVETFGYSF